jgi:hypothetical protein
MVLCAAIATMMMVFLGSAHMSGGTGKRQLAFGRMHDVAADQRNNRKDLCSEKKTDEPVPESTTDCSYRDHAMIVGFGSGALQPT